MLVLCIGTVSAETPSDSVVMNSTTDTPASVSADTGGAETLLGASNEENSLLSADNKNFADLNDTISDLEESKIYILDETTYTYDNNTDGSFLNGIVISLNNVTIDFSGSVIDGANLAHIFQVTGNNVTLKNIQFINANATNGGAVTWTGENGTINNAVFTSNYATGSGGAIYWTGNNATINNTIFTSNYAGANGGAIYLTGNNATIENAVFTSNIAVSNGAAMVFTGEDLNLNNVNFTKNKAGAGLDVDYYSASDIVAHVKGYNSYFNALYTIGTGTLTYKNVRYWNGKEEITGSDSVLIDSAALTPVEGVTVHMGISDSNGVVVLDFTNITDEEGNAYFNLEDYYSDGSLNFVNRFVGNDYYFPSTQSTVYGGGGEFQNLQNIINTQAKEGNLEIKLTGNVTYSIGLDNIVSGILIKYDNVTIDGQGYTINALGMSRIFQITANNVTIKNINFINGNFTGYIGHDIYIQSSYNVSIINCNFNNSFIESISNVNSLICIFESFNINITYCDFINNTGAHGIYAGSNSNNVNISYCNFIDNNMTWNSNLGGAAILTTINGVEINYCNFTNNLAYSGGAILSNVDYGTLNIVFNCTFINNTAAYGGAIRNTFNILNSTFINNKATVTGGVYYLGWAAYSDILYSKFINNSAGNYGGVLSMDNSVNRYDIHNCTFINNSAGNGGAIYSNRADAIKRITNCTFNNNTATNNGGAIYMNRRGGYSYSNDCIVNSVFTNNSAGSNGGALFIYFYEGGTRYFALKNLTFTGNTAKSGGAIYRFMSQATWISCDNITFIDNHATNNGGALFLDTTYKYGNLNFYSFHFYNNTAVNYGGAVCIGAGTTEVILHQCEFENNNVTNYGSAISRISAAILTLNNCKLLNNRAGSEITVTEENNVLTGHLIGRDSYLNAIYSVTNNALNINNVTYWDGTQIVTSSASKTNINKGAYLKTDIPSELVNITILSLVETKVNTSETTDDTGIVNYDYGSVAFDDKGAVAKLSFAGNSYYLPSNASLTLVPSGEFYLLQKYINEQIADGNLIITLPKSKYTYTIDFDNITEGINISVDNVVIDGNGSTIDAQGMSRIFNITGANVTIKNINFVNGSAVDGGAINWIGDNGTLTSSNFTSNVATSTGGAISWIGDNGTLIGSNFTSNVANNGGAVSWVADNATLFNCNFTNNTGTSNIALSFISDNANLSYCTFSNNFNTVSTGLGVVGVSGFNSTYEHLNFYNNTLSGSTVLGAYGDGTNESNSTINTIVFKDNVVKTNVAGITINDVINFKIINVEFINNTATGNAIVQVYNSNNVSITDSQFEDNVVGGNGIIFINAAHNITVMDSVFTNNTVKSSTGIIHVTGVNHTIEECAFTDNNVTYDIYNQGNLSLTHNTLRNLIYDDNVIRSPTNVTILENNTIYAGFNESTVITAIILDDNNNPIQLSGFEFILENGTAITPTFDFETGTYSASYIFDAVGTYIINATSSIVDNLTDCSIFSGTVIVTNPAVIVVSVEDINYTDIAKINITINNMTLSKSDDGEVIVTIIGDNNYTENYTISLSDFTQLYYISPVLDAQGHNITVPTDVNYLLEVSGLNVSDYSVFVEFTGNDQAGPSANNTTFTVNKIDPDIIIDVEDIVYGDNATVNVTVPGTGNITVRVAGKTYNITEFNISDLNAGIYDVIVVYSGDNNYNSNITFGNFTVLPVNSTLTVSVDSICEGNDAIVNITLVDSEGNNLTGIVTVKVNDTSIDPISIIVNNGSGSGVIAGLSVGQYNVTAEYSGSLNYVNSTNNTVFSVTAKNNVSINVSDVIIHVGENATVNVNISDAVNGQNITITVNGKKQSVTVVDGKASANFTDLKVGEFEILVEYPGDETYNANTANATLTVNQINTYLTTIKK